MGDTDFSQLDAATASAFNHEPTRDVAQPNWRSDIHEDVLARDAVYRAFSVALAHRYIVRREADRERVCAAVLRVRMASVVHVYPLLAIDDRSRAICRDEHCEHHSDWRRV